MEETKVARVNKPVVKGNTVCKMAIQFTTEGNRIVDGIKDRPFLKLRAMYNEGPHKNIKTRQINEHMHGYDGEKGKAVS